MKFPKINEFNILLDTDSYKYSHPQQLPEDLEEIVGYLEPRKDNYTGQIKGRVAPKGLLWIGLQAILQKTLNTPFTQADIDEAEPFILEHGLPFNREGFEYILKTYGGVFPIRIEALKEGYVVPFGNATMRIRITDKKCLWAFGFLETMLMRVWYPCTVATISLLCKDIIMAGLQKTSDDPEGSIHFKLHDFGSRGASSRETAGLGGMAHLVNFKGSDTVMGLIYARNHYNAEMAGFSIPAAEHSTITIWKRARESDAYKNMLKQFGKPGATMAVVSDSYNLAEAVKMWGTELKPLVIDSGAVVVIRPDSGDPISQVVNTVAALDKYYGSVVNKKGYKVLNNVRVIQGDGIDPDMIKSILFALEINGFSADNVAFGMGGALLQKVDRDTFSFAMKVCAARDGDGWFDVYKDPVAGGKTSKKGQVQLVYRRSATETGYRTVTDNTVEKSDSVLFKTIFDGTKATPDTNPYMADIEWDHILANSNKAAPDYFVDSLKN